MVISDTPSASQSIPSQLEVAKLHQVLLSLLQDNQVSAKLQGVLLNLHQAKLVQIHHLQGHQVLDQGHQVLEQGKQVKEAAKHQGRVDLVGSCLERSETMG